jgi:hypothetical protein
MCIPITENTHTLAVRLFQGMSFLAPSKKLEQMQAMVGKRATV